MNLFKKIFFTTCFILNNNFPSTPDPFENPRWVIINVHESHGINTQGFFSKLKNTIAYSGATLVVGYLIKKYLEFYGDSKNLVSKNSWAHWKSEVNFKNLNDQEKENLKKELEEAINKKYKDSYEFVSNQEAFNHHIEEEINSLENYIKLGRNLKKFNLSSFTSINEKKLKLAKIKLQRLYFLKKL